MDSTKKTKTRRRYRRDYSALKTEFTHAVESLGYVGLGEFSTALGHEPTHFSNAFRPDTHLTRTRLFFLIDALEKNGASDTVLQRVAHAGVCKLVELAGYADVCIVSKVTCLDWVMEEAQTE